ncbi:MAG: SAM-dependent methyltransferase [Elusimicrobiota bacterium]
MKILDATCGFKGMWYQKNHPFVTFMDKRKGIYDFDNPSTLSRYRKYNINPDIVSEWKHAPFPDNYFDMVIFDPPHLIKSKKSKVSNMMKAYGYLEKEIWKQDLKQGIRKLFDVLKPEGIFILKWCENNIKVEEILKLFPYEPLFGSNTKSKGHTATFWILFIKHRLEETLEVD